MVLIKSEKEIQSMRQSGKLVAQVLQNLVKKAVPGVSLLELDAEAERLTYEYGAKPAFKGYLGYQHCLCTSVNEQIVHGIPTTRKLKEGDIIGLDFGLVYQGYFGDSAVTVPIGMISLKAKDLLERTKGSLYAGIAAAVPGNTIRHIASAIENFVFPYKYGIVRDFVGHGIGQRLHEEPQVPNFSQGASDLELKPGMTLAIEPMINEGTQEVRILADRWTAVTADGKLSAHFEHTILITEGKAEILTEWPKGQFNL